MHSSYVVSLEEAERQRERKKNHNFWWANWCYCSSYSSLLFDLKLENSAYLNHNHTFCSGGIEKLFFFFPPLSPELTCFCCSVCASLAELASCSDTSCLGATSPLRGLTDAQWFQSASQSRIRSAGECSQSSRGCSTSGGFSLSVSYLCWSVRRKNNQFQQQQHTNPL